MPSVFDNPWQRGLFGDGEGAAVRAASVQFDHMRAFEAALARGGEAAGPFGAGMERRAADAIERAEIQLGRLADGMLRDAAGSALSAVRFGATSRRVLDTMFALMLRDLSNLLDRRLARIEPVAAACNGARTTRNVSISPGRYRHCGPSGHAGTGFCAHGAARHRRDRLGRRWRLICNAAPVQPGRAALLVTSAQFNATQLSAAGHARVLEPEMLGVGWMVQRRSFRTGALRPPARRAGRSSRSGRCAVPRREAYRGHGPCQGSRPAQKRLDRPSKRKAPRPANLGR